MTMANSETDNTLAANSETLPLGVDLHLDSWAGNG